jgi:hypothetical protein
MTEDKDRFGAKLREKRKAEEDTYFAEQDRAKLEKLRQAAGQPTWAGMCPRCLVKLNQREHHDVQIDECPKCGGLWLDKGELQALIEREDESWASRWLRSVLS